MKLKFTPSARHTFLAAIRFIKERGNKPLAAEHFYQKANQKLKQLATFPESGRRIPEFPELEHRELLVHPYRFFYRVSGKTVWIVAIWHQSQIPDQLEG